MCKTGDDKQSQVARISAAPSLVQPGRECSPLDITFQRVYISLKELNSRWEEIGILLGVPLYRLDGLSRTVRTLTVGIYRNTLKAWYNNDEDVSWNTIISV